MITKLNRVAVTYDLLTEEDRRIMFTKHRLGIFYSMVFGDRRDAELMFARTDAAHDTGVPATVSQIIRS